MHLLIGHLIDTNSKGQSRPPFPKIYDAKLRLLVDFVTADRVRCRITYNVNDHRNVRTYSSSIGTNDRRGSYEQDEDQRIRLKAAKFVLTLMKSGYYYNYRQVELIKLFT